MARKKTDTEKVLNASANFVPVEINEIGKDFILNFIKEKHPEDIPWLKNLAKKTTYSKKLNRDIPITFLTIRQEFAKKYFPNLIKPAKPKEKTFFELIDEL